MRWLSFFIKRRELISEFRDECTWKKFKYNEALASLLLLPYAATWRVSKTLTTCDHQLAAQIHCCQSSTATQISFTEHEFYIKIQIRAFFPNSSCYPENINMQPIFVVTCLDFPDLFLDLQLLDWSYPDLMLPSRTLFFCCPCSWLLAQIFP